MEAVRRTNASQHSLCLHCPHQSGNFSHASTKNEFIGNWHHPSSSWHICKWD